MRSEVRLDSAVFQLTPTRTRCDLVIISNGKTEKVATGLLNPFLTHLKAAEDQIVKGGYSITLEPDLNKDTEWFTKGTVERFVRFVSTPEVLERVNTIESEIVQIEDAIAVQGNDSLGVTTVENHQIKTTDSVEGSRPTNYVADGEKAIVLHKPGSHAPDSNGSIAQEENSKVHLLRVLETRKTVLQKEQGMAFARAVAAGFDLDHLSQLISFAECFGATRMLDACIRFMDLWKAKHESGQWLEIEAAEALSSRSEFSSFNASGIILSGDINKQREFGEVWPVTNGDLSAESNGRDGVNAGEVNSGQNKDRRSPSDDHHTPSGPHDYYQGQFQHPMFPQWPIQSAPGAPMFQPYPVQSMPYYQNYPGSAPYFQSPYPPMEDPRFTNSHRMGLKRSSMDSKDSATEPEAWEVGISGGRSKDFNDQNLSEDEKEIYRGSRKKSGRSGKKKRSGKIVTRSSKRHDTSESESESASSSETEEDYEHHESPRRKHKHSSRSKKKNSQKKSLDVSDVHDKDEVAGDQNADSGNWQVFQSFLMRDEDANTNNVDRAMFSGEHEPPLKRKESKVSGDPFLPPERDDDNVLDLKVVEFDSVNGKTSRLKQVSSNDVLLISTGRGYTESHLDPQFEEIEGGGVHRTSANDEFMVYGPEKQPANKRFSDPLAETEFEHAVQLETRATYNATDESFIVPFREDTQEELLADSRPPLDMESELPLAIQRSEDSSSKLKDQFYYEPHELSLIPEREMERESVGYDPAIDYDMEIHIEDTVKVNTSNQEDDQSSAKEDPKKLSKEKKPKAGQDVTEKRKMELIRRGRLSKPNPLAEAQARAEKLRSFKADLQKVRKEKEEEALKRLEALKLERQKRIAARSGSVTSQSTLTPQQPKARPQAKVSPGSYKGSKFNDSEPGSSPMQKLPGRTTSLGSNDSHITTKTSKLNLGTPVVGKELSRSVSSLPDVNKESDGLVPEEKAASLRTKRLSDPKFSNNSHAPPKKAGSSSDKTPKKIASDEPQKISAILHLDKTKSATLPELKIKTVKSPSDSIQKKSANKDPGQKVAGTKSSLTSQTNGVKGTNEKTSKLGNGDESPVIEKNIVMLQNDSNPASVTVPSEETVCIKDGPDGRATVELASECAAIHTPSVLMGETDPEMHKVVHNYAEDESQKSLDLNVTDKTYQPPYARATSLENPFISNLHDETVAVVDQQMMSVDLESIKAHAPDLLNSTPEEQIHDTFEKPRSKESSKGLRKLFKFGKKNHSSASGDHNLESDCSSVDDCAVSAVATDVRASKNLISQDDMLVGGSMPKVSRPFSILSPFRTKTSEKKVVV
ncbi:hypothetical protein J5N97_023424 [Dioscorea zingiberensis]|uniref:COP1-interacting protein 7 n=1 Tax=Dioscorea zingiberensis TaxID=325984 RepID=A0A9D5C5P4_9LILI|nr:hypothetical protein J5N97_023424 [Dioscorea zingiberensis]